MSRDRLGWYSVGPFYGRALSLPALLQSSLARASQRRGSELNRSLVICSRKRQSARCRGVATCRQGTFRRRGVLDGRCSGVADSVGERAWRGRGQRTPHPTHAGTRATGSAGGRRQDVPLGSLQARGRQKRGIRGRWRQVVAEFARSQTAGGGRLCVDSRGCRVVMTQCFSTPLMTVAGLFFHCDRRAPGTKTGCGLGGWGRWECALQASVRLSALAVCWVLVLLVMTVEAFAMMSMGVHGEEFLGGKRHSQGAGHVCINKQPAAVLRQEQGGQRRRGA